jgi:hypothetical protein
MKTFNRKPYEIDTTLKNISKYDNQLTFTGIKQSKNIYEVDQKSQMDTLNVYINDENTLVSREPLVEDELDIELDGELIDIKETNGVKVYVTKTETNYKIIAKRDDEIVELTATEYHLAVFNQYIICFRTEGAQVINTNKDTLVWTNLSDQTEVPITKITTGTAEKEFDGNQLTDSYSELFVGKKDLSTILPKKENAEITGKVYNDFQTTTLTDLDQPWLNSKFNILREIKAPIEAGKRPTISLAYNTDINKLIICAGTSDKVHISYDGGDTFSTIYYPEKAKTGKVISDDGRCYFYITNKCVWRLSIGDLTWTSIFIHNDENTNIVGSINDYHFLNAENFCFWTRLDTDDDPEVTSGASWATDANEVRKIRVYFKGIKLQDSSTNIDKLCYTDFRVPVFVLSEHDGRDSTSIRMCIDENLGARVIIGLPGQNNGPQDISSYNVSRIYGIFSNEDKIANYYQTQYKAETNFAINKLEPIKYTDENVKEAYGVKLTGVKTHVDPLYYIENKINKETHVYYETTIIPYNFGNKINIQYFENVSKSIVEDYWPLLPNTEQEWFPIYINNNTFISERGFMLYYFDGRTNKFKKQYLPNIDNKDMQRYNSQFLSNFNFAIADENIIIYYVNSEQIDKSIIVSNILTDIDTFEFKYTYNISKTYNQVPTLSYSGSELFLAFNNELMITKNNKDGSNILFNLPKINNQSFVDNITNMINISTSELAIFFKNNILICTRQNDETFGYIYNYSKTRLSLGVRFGDDVINTLDGANSIFPTVRGLAIMNYQAYMATTDQMLTFATDNINQLWNEFYSKSSNIKIIQMRNYIYLSNGTDEYLMFDVRTASWWKFKIPFKITKMLTDQLHLNVISSKLYKLDTAFDKNKYIDSDSNTINWYIISQRLHLGAINHYKNLKQLIFQLVQSNTYENTIDTEIKLYRKIVSYKEPDTIKFKVDEYRTFVKRFNYWKVNELQWCLSNDNTTATPAQLILNGIDIKYEIGEEVR